jgi:hypothetical protein
MRRRHAITLLGAGLVAGCGRRTVSAEAAAPNGNLSFAHRQPTSAPDAIWALWIDVEGWPRWDTALRRATLTEPIGLGARGRLVPVRGLPSRFEITQWEPRRRYAFTTALPGASLVVTRTLLPDGRFEHAVEFLGPRAEPWARRLGPDFRRALPGVMQRLNVLAVERAR